jgi:hypothetical protein
MGWREEYLRRDSSLGDAEASRRFALRHRLGLWFGVLPFLGFFLAGFVFAKFNGHLGAFAAGWICGLLLLAYVGLMYRCPRCGTVPSSSKPGTTGVLLFPKKCPKCKAPLLPNHRWGQD